MFTGNRYNRSRDVPARERLLLHGTMQCVERLPQRKKKQTLANDCKHDIAEQWSAAQLK